jgi:hypothetical protein|tara:strand:- start:2271 stop:2648 length:378 start_codon:yes stop_codon:yes gene_type:complete
MYKRIYWISIFVSFLIGQIIFSYEKNYGIIIFLGVLIPILVSYINIEIIERLTKSRGHQTAYGYNIAQFVVKSIFLCLMTFIGVRIIELNFKIFIPVLCFTWFVFHTLEAFFTNDLINDSIKNKT